jgi:hypothetical protein
MLEFKNGSWALPPFKVIYKQHGETLEQYTHDKQWWIDFAAQWEHTEILEFVDVTYTEVQLERLEEVQDITSEGFEYYAARYVLDGIFPDQLEGEEKIKHHPFKTLQLEKGNKELGQLATDLDIRLLMQELS